ncbi:diguanylate cyclase [Bosea sp. AS-1]|uniref:diguanylate cyclase domain-containing protein n=1 Tax=Bosea sp. AS-1 TaxID=2015316 RepID=UPI0020BEE163|nr:diguanylate cyclase [Bosea sp. AS-1]
MRSRVGEAGADTIVQQTAAILLNAVRTSDVVISMGRETFLVIRVEAELQEATSFAQRIADSYRVSHFTVDGQTIQENTLKFGVAVYDGSSDSRRLVDQVASALRGYNEAV